MSKHVQIGDWIFEVKLVRALKVAEYGQPYSAIANCNINGDTMYIDGLLTKEEKNFTRNDFQSFNDFCQLMGVKQCSYHRYQSGESKTKDMAVTPNTDVKTDDVTDKVATITTDAMVAPQVKSITKAVSAPEKTETFTLINDNIHRLVK